MIGMFFFCFYCAYHMHIIFVSSLTPLSPLYISPPPFLSVNSMDDASYDARMHTYFQELEDEKLRKELTIRQGEARKEIALRKMQQQSQDEESITSKKKGTMKMDLSTQGTLMKKEDELEQIQKMVNDSDVKQKIYNEDGQLLDTWEKNKCRGGDSDDESSSENDEDVDEASNVEDEAEKGSAPDEHHSGCAKMVPNPDDCSVAPPSSS